MVAHHKIPLGDGGADDGSNIEPLPVEEHMKRHEKDTERFGKRANRICK